MPILLWSASASAPPAPPSPPPPPPTQIPSQVQERQVLANAPGQGPPGNIEVYLEYGGDFVLTPQGDLLVVSDRDDDGLATYQRLERLIMTSPTLKDASGAPFARADDMFNPKFGVGGRRLVGRTQATQDLVNQVKAAIAAGLAADPGIVQNPPPVINVSVQGAFLVIGPIQVTTVTGQLVTYPSEPLGE